MVKKILLFVAPVFLAGLAVSPLQAEPLGRWWSGGGMGDIEYGFNRGDGNEILFSCNPGDADRLYLSVNIDGHEPFGKYVVFFVNGTAIEFFADHLGYIEMKSRVNVNNLYFLFDEIRIGSEMKVWSASKSIYEGKTRLAGLKDSERKAQASTVFPLKGSAKALGKSLCGR